MFGPLLEGYQPDVAYTKLVTIDGITYILCFDKHGNLMGYNYVPTKVTYSPDHKVADTAKLNISIDLSTTHTLD